MIYHRGIAYTIETAPFESAERSAIAQRDRRQETALKRMRMAFWRILPLHCFALLAAETEREPHRAPRIACFSSRLRIVIGLHGETAPSGMFAWRQVGCLLVEPIVDELCELHG